MLRHVRDIKSPMVRASEKRDAKKRAARRSNGTLNDKIAPQNTSPAKETPHPPALPSSAPDHAIGQCIAVYPYWTERPNEFDVTCGDRFVIISKSRGWWVVQRDSGLNMSEAILKAQPSAWIPSGTSHSHTL